MSAIGPAPGWNPISPRRHRASIPDVPPLWVADHPRCGIPAVLRYRKSVIERYGNRTLWLGEYRNVAVTGEGRIIDLRKGRAWSPNRQRALQSCLRHFDSGVAVARGICVTGGGWQYGHWNHDVFAGLLLWPRELLSSSVLVVAAAHAASPYAAEMLGWLGVQDRVVPVARCSWVWVRELHDVWPRPVFLEWPLVIALLRQYVEQHFGLFSGSRPSRCVLMQRTGQFRFIWNMKEVCAEFAGSLREWHFEIWRCRRHGRGFTMVDALWFYASLLFLLAAEGSNLAATLYMHEGTVSCEVRGARHDWFWTRACWFVGLSHIICRIPEMPSFEASSMATGTLDLAQVRRAVVVVGALLRRR